MAGYRRNHYVPVWYQKRFIPFGQEHNRLYYLNLHPQKRISSGGHSYVENRLKCQGPKKCFVEDNLYTTYFSNWASTEIEEKFFGKIDRDAPQALDYFSTFNHPSANPEALRVLVNYLSIQKLRTPKGLYQLSKYVNVYDRNSLLIWMQKLQDMYCAIWIESIWSIMDASQANTKFIVSDHPVTLYNKNCYPGSKYCSDGNDPDIRFTGTHTIFPLDLDKVLILTNLSWVRNPYSNPLRMRPNPNMFRDAIFNFQQIQINRKLNDIEVNKINYIIKNRAYNYIAAAKKDYLFPEDKIGRIHWKDFGETYFLMPDPRSLQFTSDMYIGHTNGRTEHFDEYGRESYGDTHQVEKDRGKEWRIFQAFIGEYSRLKGPRRYGVAFNFDRLDNEIDSDDMHDYHLSLEQKFRKPRYRKKNRRRNKTT